MPRPPRYPLIGVPQHVIQRGNNRQPTFFTQDDFRFYGHCLKQVATNHDCEVHAYVLMTNHVHLLMTPRRTKAIAKVIQSLRRRYVQSINATYYQATFQIHQSTADLLRKLGGTSTPRTRQDLVTPVK